MRERRHPRKVFAGGNRDEGFFHQRSSSHSLPLHDQELSARRIRPAGRAALPTAGR
jgi:hypothetical protein